MIKNHEKIRTASLLTLAILALISFLYYTRHIAVPFTFAIFIYLSVSPFVDWLQARWKTSKWFSITITAMLFLGISSAVAIFSVYSIQQFIEGVNVYQDRVLEVGQLTSNVANYFHISLDATSIEENLKKLPIFSIATNVTGNILGFIGYCLLVFILIIFMILGEPKENQRKNTFILDVQGKIGKYTYVKLLTSAMVSLTTFILLISLGTELSFMFTLIAFISNFIPNIGAIVTIASPLPIIFLQHGFGFEFYFALIVSSLIQFAIANLLEARLFGEALELHPITVLLALLFWGTLWGLPGMFLAVPLTAILKTILDKQELTRPLAQVMAGDI